MRNRTETEEPRAETPLGGAADAGSGHASTGTPADGGGSDSERARGRSTGGGRARGRSTGGGRAGAASPSVYALLEPQVVQLGGVPVRAGETERAGRTWELPSDVGSGWYWYFAVDDTLAVGAMNLKFNHDGGFVCDADDCFFFGSYDTGMLPYLGAHGLSADRTVLGHVWQHRRYYQPIHAHRRLAETFVVLTPEGLGRMSLALNCDPVVASCAIASLDGTNPPAGLATLLDEMRLARPTATTAPAYYRAKATEACALVVDRWLRRPRPDARVPSPEDLAALDRARRHVQDNLAKPVRTDELCRVAHMGSSKLIGLFKEVEHVTPQAYARQLRMERACELLLETDEPLKNIARQVGFERQGSFTEAFCARYGITPTAWRRAMRLTQAS